MRSAAHPWLLASALALGACSSSPPALVLDVRVVTPAGEDPVAGGGFDTATVRIREGEGEVRELVAPIEGGSFDFGVSFAELDPELNIGLELSGPGARLIGAPPAFRPALSGGSLAIPVGVPGTCEAVAGVALDMARADLGLAYVDGFALAVGGRTDVAPEASGLYLDLLRLEVRPPIDLGAPLGRARAEAYGTGTLFVLSESGAQQLTDGILDVTLHEGAGPASALALRIDGGLTVAGGAVGEVATDGVTQISPTGALDRLGRLLVARRAPAAVAVGDEVWVAGGAAGAPLVEALAPGRSAEVRVADVADGERYGAALFVDPAARRALLLGGVDGAGEPRDDTWLVSCDAGCVAAPGPRWEAARAGATFVSGGNVIVGGEGPSDLVERVEFDDAGAHLVPVARLATPRGHAAAIELASGMLWVVGGEDDHGLRRDVEVCFPSELRAP